MQSFPKLILVAVCVVVALGAESQEQGGKKKSRDKEKPEAQVKDGKTKTKNKSDKGKKGSDEETEKESRRMPFPLPVGHGGKGLTIPYLDGTARKTMNFSVGTAQRVDADNVEMGEVRIETYDEEANPEMTIDMPVSKINLTTRVISTEKHVQITRDDFLNITDLFGAQMGYAKNSRKVLAAFPLREYWIDVGRIEDLERAKRDAREPDGHFAGIVIDRTADVKKLIRSLELYSSSSLC